MLTLRYLRYWHTRYNKQCFGGRLGKPILEILPNDPDAHGYCIGTEPVTIQIEQTSDLYLARRVLLHEMIHQWQMENKLGIDHGSTFKRKATQCFDLTGLSPV